MLAFVVLMISTAICGVLMLGYKREVMAARQAIDNATSREIDERARADEAVEKLARRIERLRR